MGKIKKAGVCIGVAAGGLLGGTVSLIGKMTDKKVIDELGSSIMDSTILTGEIAGEAASGAVHLVSGAVRKEPADISKGKKELGAAGEQVVGNLVTNIKMVAGQSEEVFMGVKEKDKKRIAKGLRTMGKMALVGLLTVGAIKMDEMEKKPEKKPEPPVTEEVSVKTEVEVQEEKAHITLESLLSEKPTLEEELEEKIRF